MTNELVWIPPQTAVLGSEQHYAEEGPTRRVAVDGFSIQTHQVTNAEFAEFIAATGYLTVAERPLEPGRLSRCAGGEPAAGVDGVHPHRAARSTCGT